MNTSAQVLPFPQAQASKSGKSGSNGAGSAKPSNPGRPTDAAMGRTRSYLTSSEVDALMKAARSIGRHGYRDSTMILLAYRHGLRVSELLALKWDQLDLGSGLLAVLRAKKGTPSTSPLGGPEIRALRRLRASQGDSRHVFQSERGAPLTNDAFRRIVRRAGELAGIPFPVTCHQLRHACGFYLANRGRDTRAIQLFLGHRNIQHTCRYTQLAANRFSNFWQD